MPEKPVHLLAADVGATNSRFRLSRLHNGTFATVAESRTESGSAEELKDGLRAFVREAGSPTPMPSAVFGLPGRVSADRRSCAITYLDPEEFVAFDDLFADLGVDHGLLLNDVESGALGVAAHAARHGGERFRYVCGPGERRAGDTPENGRHGRIVLGMPGTGVGVGLALESGETIPTEGGNLLASLDLDDETEAQIGRFVAREAYADGFAIPTWEDLLRGPGIPRLFRCLLEQHPDPALRSVALRDLDDLSENDRPKAVVSWARCDQSPYGDLARRLFVVYGRFFGRMMQSVALLTSPSAVFLGGSIVGSAVELFSDSFTSSFQSHPLYQGYLRGIPVRLVDIPDLNLDGATYKASLLL